MSKVSITRSLLDDLAMSISTKSGEPVPLTLAEMKDAVDSISGGGTTIDPLSVTANGTYTAQSGHAYSPVTVNVSAPTPTLQTITKSYTPTESQQTETITAGGGYDGIEEVDVTVGAISSTYVGTGITRRSSSDLTASGATVTVPSGYYSAQASKAVASGTAGTPTATKGTVNNHSVSVTPSVTNSTGYITGGTKTGPAVSVSASELVSGTYTVDSSGTKDVTNYASASVPAGTAGTPSASKAAVSNHSVSVTPSVTNTTGWITGSTKTGTAVTVSASELVSGTYTVDSSGTKDVTNYASASVPAMTLPNVSSTTSTGTRKGSIVSEDTNSRYLNIPVGFNNTAQYYEISPCVLGQKNITSNGTYYAEDDDLYGYGAVTVNVSGGGSSMQIGNMEGLATSSSISFTGLQGEPTAFSVMVDTDVATGTPSKIVAVVFDGTSLHAQTITNTTNAQATYDSTSLSKTYSNGTLTITSNGPSFVADVYYGVYVYDGGAVETKDVQVGSGATSITFTGLEDEPAWWSCIFKSNFGTSSGYQRVIYVAKGNTTTNVSGLEMDSRAHNNSLHWTTSYSNGSFTITSQGTNAGGYFHQPGYYQLTYAYDDGSSGNYQSKTVTPTTSQQVIEADSGYDALEEVIVNAMPTMTLPSSASSTSSGTSKATITPTSSAQYLNIPTGYNGTAQYYTIAASGGGTSKNVQVLQSTSRTNSSSLTKVLGDLTVSKTGTYDVYWSGGRSNTSASYTWGTRLYVDGTGYGTENTTWTNNCQSNHLSNVSLTANQKLSVYARGRTGSYYTFAPMLVIIEA